MLLGVFAGLLLAGAPDSAPNANQPAATPKAEAPKPACRRLMDTGSLVQGRKICVATKPKPAVTAKPATESSSGPAGQPGQ